MLSWGKVNAGTIDASLGVSPRTLFWSGEVGGVTDDGGFRQFIPLRKHVLTLFFILVYFTRER